MHKEFVMTQTKKLTVEEFVLLAIQKLRTGHSKGIHCVYSGFNEAFRKYFPGKDPVVEVEKLAKQGIVTSRLCKGGAMIYKGNSVQVNNPETVFNKMGL